MYIDNSNDSCRGICAVGWFIVVLLVVLHVSGTNHNRSQIQVYEYLSNKYHRVWCTIAVGTEWVGHSSVANAHFGQSACSGLWLLSANHGISDSLSAVPNLAMTTSPMFTKRLFRN